jgi:hypothetical protein
MRSLSNSSTGSLPSITDANKHTQVTQGATPDEQQQIARENYEWHERIFGPPPVPGPPAPGGSDESCPCKHAEDTGPKSDIEKIVDAYMESTHVLDLAAVNASIFVGAGGQYVAGGALIAGGCLDPTPFEPVTCAAGSFGGGIAFAGGTGTAAFGVWFFKNVTLPAIEGDDCSN